MRKQRVNGKKVIIGITGSFASGKSTVASFFSGFGAKVIDADAIAHRCMKKGSAAYAKIRSLFGPGILDKSGSIDRRLLAKLVFDKKPLLKKLNSVVHPCVIAEMKRLIKVSGKRFIVLDAPLLIEAGLEKMVDKMIVVTADKKVQIERARKDKGFKRKDAEKRINSQLPLKTKARFADFIIDNNGTKKETRKQVEEAWKRIVNLS